jgi:hypothetical protein
MPTSTKRLTATARKAEIPGTDRATLVESVIEVLEWRPFEVAAAVVSVASVVASLLVGPVFLIGLVALVGLARQASPKRYLFVTDEAMVVIREGFGSLAVIGSCDLDPADFGHDGPLTMNVGPARVKISSGAVSTIRTAFIA